MEGEGCIPPHLYPPPQGAHGGSISSPLPEGALPKKSALRPMYSRFNALALTVLFFSLDFWAKPKRERGLGAPHVARKIPPPVSLQGGGDVGGA
jgi:hypothetical protein